MTASMGDFVKKHKILLNVSLMLLILGAAFAYCIWNGIILLNNPSKEKFPVRGVDVSHYQGEIDWQVLSQQEEISFAFIKATEGSSSVDSCFAYNYEEAQKTDLRVGAYHFFSFDSAGETQAENFIKTVEKTEDMLPPVIDLEFYGDKADNPPEAEGVRREMEVLINALKEHYGMAPILYVTKESYTLYVEGYFKDCDIWYRNVVTSSGLPDGREMTFWQYTNRETLAGYDGDEQYIDMNVFRGTAAEFENYGK